MHKIGQAVAGSLVLTLLAAASALAQSASPTLNIITPAENQTIYGDRIPVLVQVENFEVVDYQKNPKVKTGQGHIHLWLDDASPTPQSAVKVTSDTHIFTNTKSGDHTLRAELVGNNHASLKPPVVTTVKFKSAPTLSPPPAATQSGFDKNTALVILIVVALVILAAWWYTKEEEEPPTKSKVKSQSRKSKSKATKKRK